MDFSLHVGDEYRLDDYSHTYIVTAVSDTILENSFDRKPRRCIHLSLTLNGEIISGDYYRDVWIEGIGSVKYGLMGMHGNMPGGSCLLMKCTQQESVIYQYDDATPGQGADMFVDKRKSWKCLNEWPGWEPEVHMYEFSGDVTANGKTYSELLMDGSHPYLLRQEGNKVFMVYNNKEVLLYDFGLEVGDKFSFTGKESENLVVMDVNFITVGDRVRRRMIFAWERYLPKDYDVQSLSSQDYSAIDCWVEGIGSVYGPVSPMTPFMIGGRYRAQSCLLDGSVIFSYSDFGVDPYNPQDGSSVAIQTQTENVRQPVFDLQGRKLLNSQWSNSQIRRGLYIQNGKKVVVK